MNYEFNTQRLIVKRWHAFNPEELKQPELVDIVHNMLDPDVTKTFPVMWQGTYSKERTQSWIEEHDAESKALLAIEKNTKKPIGIITFFNVGDRRNGLNLRLGYLVSKVMWNKKFGTELIEGFTHWCRENNIASILAGVAIDNTHSIRILEKNNFSMEKPEGNGNTLLYVYKV